MSTLPAKWMRRQTGYRPSGIDRIHRAPHQLCGADVCTGSQCCQIFSAPKITGKYFPVASHTRRHMLQLHNREWRGWWEGVEGVERVRAVCVVAFQHRKCVIVICSHSCKLSIHKIQTHKWLKGMPIQYDNTKCANFQGPPAPIPFFIYFRTLAVILVSDFLFSLHNCTYIIILSQHNCNIYIYIITT